MWWWQPEQVRLASGQNASYWNAVLFIIFQMTDHRSRRDGEDVILIDDAGQPVTQNRAVFSFVFAIVTLVGASVGCAIGIMKECVQNVI